MKKSILISLALLLLVFASASAIVLFTGVLSTFQTTVNPPEVTFISIPVDIPSLNSLSAFNSGTYDPAGTEISISSIDITHAYIEARGLSLVERSAFTELDCHIKIYNSTYILLNSTFSPLLNQRLYVSHELAGDWDVALRYSGTTAIPDAPIPVSFNVVINLTKDIPVCLQWFGATNQSNITDWLPLEDTLIIVTNQNCTTNHRGYCTLNLSDHALYTATANHTDYTETATRSFIACGDATNSTGYPLILRFNQT